VASLPSRSACSASAAWTTADSSPLSAGAPERPSSRLGCCWSRACGDHSHRVLAHTAITTSVLVRCDYVPVEYRYELHKRVVDTVACTALVLCGLLGMTIAILGLAVPASTGSASPSWGNGVPVFCIGAGLAYVGFVVARRTLTGRLTVTSDSLVLRYSGWVRGTRVMTMPWSTITSFTVRSSGTTTTWKTVHADLNTGQQVRLPCTLRTRRADVAAIAQELTAFATTMVHGAAAGQ
jgi:hypothetical protein